MDSRNSRLNCIVNSKTDKSMLYRTDPEKRSSDERDQMSSRSKKPRTKQDMRKVSAVLCIPRTHDGQLAKEIKTTEEQIRKVCLTKVRVVERVGPTLKSQLMKSNPWAQESCPRQDCLPCSDAEKGFDCRRRGVTYTSECNPCKNEGAKVVYI